MPDIRPFRGLFFDPAKVGGFEKVVAEPYDKVTEKMREEYLAGSPYNIVRIDLPRESLDQWDRYGTAARAFRGWIEKGIVRRAERPAVYLYEQSFELPGGPRLTRRAFIALVEAREHAKGHVLPHERTFQEPKADRMALLEAGRAQFGMVFLLYQDREKEVARALAAAAANAAPIADFRLADGTTHRIAPIEDPAAIAAARRFLAGKTCYIADGHHRYEAQVAFRREHEERSDLRPAHRYRLAAFVEAGDSGLRILPTHRLLPKEIAFDKVVEAARKWYDIGTTARPNALTVHGQHGETATLTPHADLEDQLPDVPVRVRKLAVTQLHKLLLERGLKLDASGRENALGYVRWLDEGREKVASGKYGCLIELPATSVEDVIAVADAGAVMPQKSTDFYPKLLTGLVMNDIEDDLHV